MSTTPTTRRVRRDSETSTDSWSLVEEEDHLDDDFSLNSTEDEEGAELDSEPIIEEPPTSDEDDDDTASEKSLDEESEDSDVSTDSESEDSEDSDSEEDVEESEDVASPEVVQIEDSSDDSDLSDAESESEEDSDDDEILENDDDDVAMTEVLEAARRCKEDENWMDDELEEDSADHARRLCRVLLCITIFIMIFPIADIFTSWMLAYKNHRSLTTTTTTPTTFIFDDYSPQSYNNGNKWFVWKKNDDDEGEKKKKMEKKRRNDKNNLHLLKNILNRPSSTPSTPVINSPLRSFEVLELFTNKSNQWKQQSDVIQMTWQKKEDVILEILESELTEDVKNISVTSESDGRYTLYTVSYSRFKALQPVPPAPFSPRRLQKTPEVPRHQPCLVHVNQSKWTCQKNLPAVIYHQQPNFTMMPRVFKQKKMMSYGRSGELKVKKNKNLDICAKKASQSMRNVSSSTSTKPLDQCDSRHFSKFTPRRKHISYKAPLPCQVPTYKPTIPKQSKKPTRHFEDWDHKRSVYRAQQRSRA